MQQKQVVCWTIAALLSIGLSTASVYAWETITIVGSGKTKTETRSVGKIYAVSISGVGTLLVETGAREKLTVEADDNLLPYIQTQTHNGSLELGIKPGVTTNFNSPLRYHLTVRSLDQVTLSGATHAELKPLPAGKGFSLSVSGASSAQVNKLAADSFQLSASGASRVTINSGRVRQQSLSLSGASHYEGFGLISDAATINASGNSNSNVTANRSLSVEASGVSNIRYKGKPSVHSEVSGVSSVNPAR